MKSSSDIDETHSYSFAFDERIYIPNMNIWTWQYLFFSDPKMFPH